MRRIILVALFMPILSTCIDPYPLDTPQNELILTVDGLLSTNEGPHLVRLTYANKYRDVSINMATDATVWITDENCNETFLEEEYLNTRWYCTGREWRNEPANLSTGHYYTPVGFRPKIGSKYTLNIVTKEGQHYQSSQEQVMPIVEIDTVFAIPYKTPSLNPLISNTGVEIISLFSDPKTANNYYFWRISEPILELETEPELYLLPPFHPTCPKCPAPKACCKTCYIPDNTTISIFGTTDDILFNGLSTQYPVFRIPDDGIRFKSKMRITVEQHSISYGAHFFLNQIKQQLSIQGSIFDPPPVNIRGNITNIEKPEIPALGYFMVSSVSRKTIYIKRADIPFEYRALRAIVPDDCRLFCGFQLRSPPTTTPPPIWEYN